MSKTLMEMFADNAAAGNPANLIMKAAQRLSDDAQALREQVATYALELDDRDAKIERLEEKNKKLEERVWSLESGLKATIKERDMLMAELSEEGLDAPR